MSRLRRFGASAPESKTAPRSGAAALRHFSPPANSAATRTSEPDPAVSGAGIATTRGGPAAAEGGTETLEPGHYPRPRLRNPVIYEVWRGGAASGRPKVLRADLIYSLNGRKQYEEWFRVKGQKNPGPKINISIPQGSTHYFLNLIDEHNILVSNPEIPDYATLQKTKDKFAKFALPHQ